MIILLLLGLGLLRHEVVLERRILPLLYIDGAFLLSSYCLFAIFTLVFLAFAGI